MSSSSPSSVDSPAEDAPRWFDVTSALLTDASELPVGHFLSCSPRSFSLNSAMSALELMDARMDPAMGNATHTRQPHHAQRIAGAEEQRAWSDRRVLHCADCLLQCVVTHLSGVSLAHSLYTLVLLHRHPYDELARGEGPHPEDASDGDAARVFPLLHQPLLHLLSRLALHFCLACRALVSRADVYEEEEWSMHAFNVRVEEGGTAEALGKEAAAMEQQMEADLKAAKKGRPHSADDPAIADRAALLARLRLFHSLFLLFALLSKTDRGKKGSATAKALTRAWTHFSAVASSPLLAESSPYLAELSAFLSSPSCPFDPSIASSLILHAPPRSYPLMALSASVALLHQLLVHCGLALSTSSLRTLSALLTFVSALSLQGPNIVVRSLLLLRCCDEEDVCQTGLSMKALVTSAIEELSPSTAIYFHPSMQATLFSPPAKDPTAVSPVPAPSPELVSALLSHWCAYVCGYMRLLLMDGTKVKAKLGAQVTLLAFLLQASENVDQWMAHLSITVLGWPAPADAEWRGCLYDGGFHSAALEAGCQLLLLAVQRMFAAELCVDRELCLLHWLMHRWTHQRVENRQRAWRDPKAVPVLLAQHLAFCQSLSAPASPPPFLPTAAARKKAKALLASLSPAPPPTAEWLLVDAWHALSTATAALIDGLSKTQYVTSATGQRRPLVLVPAFPDSLLPTYFSSRFSAFQGLKETALSLSGSLSSMRADFAPLTDEAALSLSGTLLTRAKEVLGRLNALHKEHPPMQASSLAALQPTDVASGLRAPALVDLSTWSLTSVDASFLRSLLVVCVSNSVTTLTLKKSAAAAAKAVENGAPSPPFRARFSFKANAVFPLVTIEPAQRSALAAASTEPAELKGAG